MFFGVYQNGGTGVFFDHIIEADSSEKALEKLSQWLKEGQFEIIEETPTQIIVKPTIRFTVKQLTVI